MPRLPAPPSDDDLGLQRLTFAQQFPAAGLPVHVNTPLHQGDVPLHDHDFLEIALIASGYAVHRTIHGVAPIGGGQALIIQPGQWHAYERAHDLQLYNCCFGTDLLLRELAWVRSDPLLATLFPARLPSAEDARRGRSGSQGVLTVTVPESEQQALIADLDALRQLQSLPDLARLRADVTARLLLVLGRLARLVAGDRSAVPLDLSGEGAVASALQAIEEHIDREWSLADLARIAKLNRSYFVRRFRRATGLSPIAYLARRRAEIAAVLLLTSDLPVAEVGRRVGWVDPNYFARRFRQAFGMSARTYREQLPLPPLARKPADWVQW